MMYLKYFLLSIPIGFIINSVIHINFGIDKTIE